MRGSLAGDPQSQEGLGGRVAALSAAKLALLNLRLRQDGSSPGGDEAAAADGAAAIPRRAREHEADLLGRLDDISDAEVDALLSEALGEDRQPPRAGRDPASPAAIPRLPRGPASDVLAEVEGMSESEVDALLAKLAPKGGGEAP
jgi:hypothetical protein